jgi:hypothetical protein
VKIRHVGNADAKLQRATVPRLILILNWNQTISVKQSLCTFHLGRARCQAPRFVAVGSTCHPQRLGDLQVNEPFQLNKVKLGPSRCFLEAWDCVLRNR